MAKISKSKNLSAGVTKKTKKAPMVDPKGAYTKVQERTLGNMKKGGKTPPKAFLGMLASGLAGNALQNKLKKKIMTEGPQIAKMIGTGGAGMLPGMKKGGTVGKDKKWIQKAVNPAHKGYCTPMTKATCTPKRKALAVTLKKMAKARKGK